MKIGILYNISERTKLKTDVEKSADEEIPSLVRLISAVLKKDHSVIPISFSPEIYSYLKTNPPDIIFNICEGFGNDNKGEAYIVGLLDSLGIPCTGSDFITLALSMDKVYTKSILNYNGLNTPAFQVFSSLDEEISNSLSFPLIVKPRYEDASIGITNESVVKNKDQLFKRVKYILEEFNQPALAEEYIDGRELNVSLIGNGPDIEVLPLSEILFNIPDGYYPIVSYDAKWNKSSPLYTGTPAVCPADIEGSLKNKIEDISKQAFKAAGCRDYARIDMRIKDNVPYIIEINAKPAIYIDTGFVRSTNAYGMDYEALCKKIIAAALKRNKIDPFLIYKPGNKGNADPISEIKDNKIYETENFLVYHVKKSHISTLTEWFNNPRVSMFMSEPEYIYSELELEEMLLISRVHNIDVIFLNKTDQEPAGYGAIYDVDYKIKTCEISFLIGNQNFIGKGLSHQIVQVLVHLAFNNLNLRNIFASAITENIPSIKALKKAGFKKIGIRRQSHFYNNQYYDEILLDKINNSFHSSSATRLL